MGLTTSYCRTTPGSQQVDAVAIDLEGSGAQDQDREVILEIAVVPIVNWQPDMRGAYSTLINPQRPVPHRPWISSGLTDAALLSASPMIDVEPQLASRINGKYLVGHNIGIDWRLLHRRCPDVIPAGLIDTRRLARTLDPVQRHDLGAVIRRLGLGDVVTRLAVGSAPHRALWDTVAVGLVLAALTRSMYGPDVTVGQLLRAAGVPFTPAGPPANAAASIAADWQPSLLEFFE